MQNCQFSHERLNEEGIKEFIKANEDFLRETKNKYGRTNMDEFFNEYIKGKDGVEEEYVMLPDFIKKEDKEKENKENNDKVPLGLIVMSNNTKILNELKLFYNMQNYQILQNKTNNNNIYFYNRTISQNIMTTNNNTINNRINNFCNINNNNNQSLSLQRNKSQNMKNNKYNYEKETIKEDIINNDNRDKKNVNVNTIVDKNKKDEKEGKHIIDNNGTKSLLNEEKNGKKEEKKEEKKGISSVEINPFMNPLLISNNDINNLF